MTDVEEILRELGLQQYIDSFLDQGFDTWETILDITESDFDALNVKLGHRRKLQRKIAEFRTTQVGLDSGLSIDVTSQDRGEGGPSGVALVQSITPVVKRRYRRHPKPDEHAPERPSSAYVIFSNKMRDDLKGHNLSFAQMAKLAGEKWQNCSPAEKAPFEQRAAQAKEQYNAEFSLYKATDNHRKYTEYLADFKAKQTENENAKRLKRQESSVSGGSGSLVTGSDARMAKLHLVESHSSVEPSGSTQQDGGSPVRSDSSESSPGPRSEGSIVPPSESPPAHAPPFAIARDSTGIPSSPQQTLYDGVNSGKQFSALRSQSPAISAFSLPSLPAIVGSPRAPLRSNSFSSQTEAGPILPFPSYAGAESSSTQRHTRFLPPPLTSASETMWHTSGYGRHPAPRPLEPILDRTPPNRLPVSTIFDVRLPLVRNNVAQRNPIRTAFVPSFEVDGDRANESHITDNHTSPISDPRGATSPIHANTQEVLDPVSALLRAGELFEMRAWKQPDQR